MKRLIFTLFLLLFPFQAFAQQAPNVTTTAVPSNPVTTSAATCVPATGNILTLFVFNNGATTVWYRPNDGTQPAASGLGSAPIPATTGLFWPNGTAPRNGLRCIAASGSDNLTVVIGQ